MNNSDVVAMTLRQYYAGQALAGLCGNPDPQTCQATVEELTGRAVLCADALIAELESEVQNEEQ
jgi:hypothetical protein